VRKFGKRIKELRIDRGWSLMDLSKESGISDASLCRWENGQADIKSEQIIILTKIFNVTSDYFLGLED